MYVVSTTNYFMNRQQIRKLAKEYKIPFKTLREQIAQMDPEVVKINLEDLPNGEKVRLKVDRILEHKDSLSQDYIDFIENNRDTVFTVKKYDNGVGKENSKRFTLNEDTTKPKWIFHLDDLTLADLTI